jgi:hypothetical protein
MTLSFHFDRNVLQVEDKPEGLPDSAFADFKCSVWHQSVTKLLESIRAEARMGHGVEIEQHTLLGLKKQMWRLFPSVSIVSADYEEQYVGFMLREHT